MSGVLSYIPVVGQFVGLGGRSRTVNVPSLEVHHIETTVDKRARCLKHLLKANHVNYSIIKSHSSDEYARSNLAAHALSSAYLLNATQPQLNDLYDAQIKNLDPWAPSPAEITDEDFEEFLGNQSYARAYLDYFEDKLAMDFAYDWKNVVKHYLHGTSKPLLYGLFGGLGEAIVRLSYAFQLDSKELAMEALALAAVRYTPFHSSLEDLHTSKSTESSTNSTLAILTAIAGDARLDGINGPVNDHEALFKEHGATILEHWNAWDIQEATRQFEDSQMTAIALLTRATGQQPAGFLRTHGHVLTTSSALGVVLPYLPSRHHIPLMRLWMMFAICSFIAQRRILPNTQDPSRTLDGEDWRYVLTKAGASKDALVLEVTDALRVARELRTDDVEQHILSAAIYFLDEFRGW